MRGLFAIFALAVFRALAFDSAEWMGKRAVLSQEAQRLRDACAEFRALADEPAEDISVPIECRADGSVKTAISAKRAQFFLDRGYVWGEGVKVLQYGENGDIEAEIECRECLIDRDTKSGWAEGEVEAVYRKNRLKGRGVYFSFAEEYAIITSNLEMSAEDLKFKGIGNTEDEQARAATVAADRADYDRAEGVMMFDGKVRLDESEILAAADCVFVFLDGTNSIRRIVAHGNVSLTNGTRFGSCDRVSYRKDDGKIEMFGSAGRRARLVDGGSRQSELEGGRIALWMDSEQIEVADAEITIHGSGFGGENGLKGIFGQ